MARIYSEVLYIAHNINSDSFTVPEGEVWVIREIRSFAAAPTAGGQIQIVDRDTNAMLYYLPVDPSAGSFYNADTDMRLVRPEGWTADIEIDVGLGEGADLVICGYNLTAP